MVRVSPRLKTEYRTHTALQTSKFTRVDTSYLTFIYRRGVLPIKWSGSLIVLVGHFHFHAVL